MERGGRGKQGQTKRKVDQNICFSWDDEYSRYSTCSDKMVFLSDFDRAIILSSLRFAHWPTRWDDVGRKLRDSQKWSDILSLVECLEVRLDECLDARSLIKSNVMLIAALTGQWVDLDAVDDEDYFTGIKDYTLTGLANRLGPEGHHTADTSLSARLAELQNISTQLAAIEADLAAINEYLNAQQAEEIEDELLEIVTKLAEIGVVIGV